jgi:predicted amidohydrolase
LELTFLPYRLIFVSTDSCPLDTLAAAETLEDGSYASSLCTLARRLGIWLSVGGFPELVDSRKRGDVEAKNNPNTGTVNKVYNTHFMISPNGCIVDRYRKIHLFDSPLAGLMESKSTEAGEALVATDCGFAKVNLLEPLLFFNAYIFI